MITPCPPVSLCSSSCLPAGRAVTIATRYTAVRRQTASKGSDAELQVLNYDNVQQTLLPLLARAYGLVFMVGAALSSVLLGGRAVRVCLLPPPPPPPTLYPLPSTPYPTHPTSHPLPPPHPRPPPTTAHTYPPQGRTMMDMYHGFDAARARNDFAVLPELHALSSGLKALCTDVTAAGIETCRRQCGGHGYMLASGLPTLFNSYVQSERANEGRGGGGEGEPVCGEQGGWAVRCSHWAEGHPCCLSIPPSTPPRRCCRLHLGGRQQR